MSHVGGAVLRMQADQASPADLLEVARLLVYDEAFRARTRALGTFTREIPEERRREACAHLVGVLLSEVDPPMYVQVRGPTEWFTTSAWFASTCAPPPRGMWERCGLMVARYGEKGRVEWLRACPFLHRVLVSVEELWNIPGAIFPSTGTP